MLTAVVQVLRQVVRDYGHTLVGGAVGAGIGFEFGALGRAQATAAVADRPDIAEATLRGATAANHGGDWLFYQYPVGMTVLMMTIWGLIGVAFGLKHD